MEHVDGKADLNELLLALLGSLQQAVVLCDARAEDVPIIYANRAFEQLTGYGSDDVVGRNCRFLQGERTSQLVRGAMRDAINSGDDVFVTALNYRADGTSFWNDIRLIPLGDAEGRPTLYVGLMGDASRRVAREATASHADILRSAAFNWMVDGVLLLDSAWMVTDANAGALRILGVTREHLASPDWWSLFQFRHPDGRPVNPAESPGVRAFQSRQSIYDSRLLMRRPDGEDRLLAFNYEPVSAPTHQGTMGLVVSFRDVTDQARSEVDLQQFASLVEISSDFIAIAGLDGQVRYVNPAGRDLIGLDSPEQAHRLNIRAFLSDAAWEASLALLGGDPSLPALWQGESSLRNVRTGAEIPVRISAYLVRDRDSGEPVALATIQHDISEERRFTTDLLASRARYQAQFQSLPIPTYLWRREADDFVLVEWNAAAEAITHGHIGRYAGTLASVLHASAPEVRAAMLRAAVSGVAHTEEQAYEMRTTGEAKQLVITYAPIPPDLVMVHTIDVTERNRSQALLQRLSEEDDLTGLHNRRYFERRLSEMIAAGRPVALVIIDIDHFKFVNDSFGHEAGDELLRNVSGLLRSRCRAGDVVARLGGDEFALLVYSDSAHTAGTAIQALLAAIRSGAGVASVTASAGLAWFDVNERLSVSDAMVAADIALYRAKQEGRDRLEVYRGIAGENLAWVQLVREAIAHDRLALVGQPAIHLSDPRRPRAYELLVRLRTESGRTLQPEAFLPTAEQFGLMHDLDRWVIEHGIAYAARGLPVGINLSARSIGDPTLPETIRSIIARTGARPDYLTFEITETAAISSIEDARAFTEALNAMGCAVALDDFGTGFGTLMLLKHLPVRYLKIDGEFVRRVAEDAADQRIVRLLVQIAQEAGMETVAEGVESAAALETLMRLGVDWAQGYHIARPGPLPDG